MHGKSKAATAGGWDSTGEFDSTRTEKEMVLVQHVAQKAGGSGERRHEAGRKGERKTFTDLHE